ncbi:hypothetical protein N9B82_01995 [Saprospiraceae bacterium]|nr:hypothetical protein [Saprospiraceae bacterium]
MKIKTENHKLFPSGEWTGFYVYKHSTEKHHKSLVMEFSDGFILGSGGDDIAAFTLSGQYSTRDLTCSFTKSYASHKIAYSGHVDENGIWGEWKNIMQFPSSFTEEQIKTISLAISNDTSGGFHIWPKSRKTSAHKTQKIKKVKNKKGKLQKVV